jgi:hypothetical protein
MAKIFVKFTNNYGPEVFQILNPETRYTTDNRDLIWFNSMYFVTPCVAITNILLEISIPKS